MFEFLTKKVTNSNVWGTKTYDATKQTTHVLIWDFYYLKNCLFNVAVVKVSPWFSVHFNYKGNSNFFQTFLKYKDVDWNSVGRKHFSARSFLQLKTRDVFGGTFWSGF